MSKNAKYAQNTNRCINGKTAEQVNSVWLSIAKQLHNKRFGLLVWWYQKLHRFP